MVAQARQHLDAKEYYFATTWLERLLKKYPTNSHRKEVLLMMSKAYAASDREERAIKTLGTLLKEYPDSAQTLDPKLLELSKKPVAAAPSAPTEVQPSYASTYRPKTIVAAAPAVAATAAAPTMATTPAVAATPVTPVALTQPPQHEEQQPARKGADPVPAAKTPSSQAVAKDEAKNPYAAALADDARDSKDPIAPPKPPAAIPAIVAPAPLPQKHEPKKAAQDAPPIVEVRTPAISEEVRPPKAAVKAPSTSALPRTAAKAAAPVKAEKVRDGVETKQAAPENGVAGGIQYHAAMTADMNLKVGQYTLKIGEYFAATTMADDKKKVAEAGLTSMVVQGPKKKAPVIRLEVEGCTDQQSAHKLLERVKSYKGDGFIVVDRGRKYHLYAGSFADQKRAGAEQRRLASLGIKSTQQKKLVDLPVLVLTAGSFATEEAAREKLKQMEKEGLHPVVVKISGMKVTTASR